MHNLINIFPIYITGYSSLLSEKLKQLYKSYLLDNELIFVSVKYNIPSLIWPPPKTIINGYLMTSLMIGLS